MFTTSGTYPWSFMTQINHSGQPSHGGDRKTFEVKIAGSSPGPDNPVTKGWYVLLLRYAHSIEEIEQRLIASDQDHVSECSDILEDCSFSELALKIPIRHVGLVQRGHHYHLIECK